MSKKIVQITSASQLSTVLSSSTYTVVDFYADWCGPCKQIAPIFSNLAEKESKPGKMQFAKVNVDSCQEVAKKYGVSAMPTFLVLKSSTVVETVRGANTSALTAAVNKAAADAARGPGRPGVSFQSKGYTLGSSTQPSRTVGESPLAGLSRMLTGNGGIGDLVMRFLGLYFTSLFTFDSYTAAEQSPFNVRAGRR